MKFEDRFENSGGGGSDLFIKLEDGESVTGVFTGEPYQFQQHSRYPEKPLFCVGGSNGCPECMKGNNASTRFRINLIVKDAGGLKAKIFEQGYYTWVTLKELSEAYDLERYTVKIKRSGQKQDTRYTILPLPDGKINDAAFEKLQQIELCNLVHKDDKDLQPKETKPPVDDSDIPPFPDDDDIPF